MTLGSKAQNQLTKTFSLSVHPAKGSFLLLLLFFASVLRLCGAHVKRGKRQGIIEEGDKRINMVGESEVGHH